MATAESLPVIHPERRQPIHETPTSVSYLGVKVEKPEKRDGKLVPERRAFEEFLSDESSIKFQRDIAIALSQGDPTIFEGGTGLGKTTTIRKVASDLGAEVYYINCTSSTSTKDLMGKVEPNTDKSDPSEADYKFFDGVVTQALTPEEGKLKILLLDEINFMHPDVLGRLHGVIDRYMNGEDIEVSEKTGRTIKSDKKTTKIFGLMNPPGGGNAGRFKIDKPQMRRWVYQKMPDKLSSEALNNSILSSFGFDLPNPDFPEEAYLEPRDVAIPRSELPAITGMRNIMSEFIAFHEAATELVETKKIAKDQRQEFTYDRSDVNRVRRFVQTFYNGDLNDTFKKAIEYYYINKLLSDTDKNKVIALAANVKYTPPTHPELLRPGIPHEPETTPAAAETPAAPETTPDIPVFIPAVPEPAIDPAVVEAARVAKELVRKEKEAWQRVFGIEVEVPLPPTILTAEVKKNLDDRGFEIMYEPEIDLGIDNLKTKGVKKYLEDLYLKYPNWAPLESLSEDQRKNPDIMRNLSEWYWNLVINGKVNQPSLPGKWIAVEKITKPDYGQNYEDNAFARELGFAGGARKSSWKNIYNAIENKKDKMLRDIGLSRSEADMRLPEALEWNIIANRLGLCGKNGYEYTNTLFTNDYKETMVIASGVSILGGAGCANEFDPQKPNESGFRTMIDLSP